MEGEGTRSLASYLTAFGHQTKPAACHSFLPALLLVTNLVICPVIRPVHLEPAGRPYTTPVAALTPALTPFDIHSNIFTHNLHSLFAHS